IHQLFDAPVRGLALTQRLVPGTTAAPTTKRWTWRLTKGEAWPRAKLGKRAGDARQRETGGHDENGTFDDAHDGFGHGGDGVRLERSRDGARRGLGNGLRQRRQGPMRQRATGK